MEELYQNKQKKRLFSGEKLSAAWAQAGNTLTCEIIAQAGFDIVLIDAEHAPIDPVNMIHMVMAAKGTDAMVMARAPWNDMVSIKRLLDCGVQGIHIPYIGSLEEAQRAVSACKYPPQGTRGIAGSPRACGYGQNRGQYIQRANDELLIMLAVETPEAIDRLEEIMTVEGIDGIFIGPFDLAASMNHLGQPGHPEVQKKIREAEQKIKRARKLMGTTAGNAAGARALYERGYDYVVFGSDTVSLAALLKAEMDIFHGYQAEV